MNNNETWLGLLSDIHQYGEVVHPRGQSTRELLGYQTIWEMKQPVISIRERKLGYRFMPAEAAWILSGGADVARMKDFSPTIKNFSDDGVMFFGAYGPKIIQQLPYVARSLESDWQSRQGVLNIWRESPMLSKDIPCTLSMQWFVRNDGDGGKVLNAVVSMRSSDAWLGIPYDVFNFSCISMYLLLYLRQMNRSWFDCQLGNLKITAGSQHLYYSNHAQVEQILNEPTSSFEVAPVELTHFRDPVHLTNYLWKIAYRTVTPYDLGEHVKKPWLLELVEQ